MSEGIVLKLSPAQVNILKELRGNPEYIIEEFMNSVNFKRAYFISPIFKYVSDEDMNYLHLNHLITKFDVREYYKISQKGIDELKKRKSTPYLSGLL